MRSAKSRDDWDHHWKSYRRIAEENPANDYRCRLIFDALDLNPAQGPERSGVRLLEVGSGQGEFAGKLRAAYPQIEILGMDVSEAGVEFARKRVPTATFLKRDLLSEAEFPPELRSWATHAVCSEILEHVDQPVVMLRNIASCLAPGCRLVVTVPGGPMSHFDRSIGHRKHYDAAGLERLLTDAGYVVDFVARAGFPFFNLYRMVVISRGKAIGADLESAPSSARGLLRGLALRVFRGLFRLNVVNSPGGWQLLAVARKAG